MIGRTCVGCGKPTGSVRKSRCDPCRAAHRAAAERERYAEARDRQSATVDEPAEPEVHGGDGRTPPPVQVTTLLRARRETLREAIQYRQNPRHDAATRARLDHAEEAEASDMTSWDQLNGSPQNGHAVAFHPAQGPGEPAVDGFGRRQRSVGAYAVDNPAAAGAAFSPSVAAGHRAVHAQQHAHQGAGRFGPNVQPAQVHAGQFGSAPHLAAQEHIATKAEQAQRQAMAEHARYLLPGRR